MSDWIGLLVIVLFVGGVLLGLKVLSKPQKRTEEEFERGVEEGPGLAGAGFNALHQMLNPEEAKKKIAVMEMKEGRYNKKKREGKAEGGLGEGNND